MSNFERKMQKYAVKNLTLALVAGYVLGYIITLVDSLRGTSFISFLTLDPWKIIHGQVWRLITWVLIPPSDYSGIQGFIFLLLMMYCCFSIGTTLERTWGTLKYNIFILGGIGFTVLFSFIGLGIMFLGAPLFGMSADNVKLLLDNGYMSWDVFSTFFINMSIYIGFAITYPNNKVLFMFFIPIKMKWLGIIDGLYFAYYIYIGIRYMMYGSIYSMYGMLLIFSVMAALVNIFVFWLFGLKGYDPKARARKARFERAYSAGEKTARARKMNSGAYSGSFYSQNDSNTASSQNKNSAQAYSDNRHMQARHKCCICGQTDISNPGLEFRYCSKCNGAYEYCNEHLFSHVHKI